MRTLCDAYYEEHESHYRAFLDISAICTPLSLNNGQSLINAKFVNKQTETDKWPAKLFW